MSSRNRGSGQLATGVFTPYRNIFDLVQDKDQIKKFADSLDVSHRNVRKDDCGQWSIIGKRSHLQTWGDLSSFVLYVAAYSERKWGAIKRKARNLGLELTQDGDDEGCFRLPLPTEAQSEFLRELLGLRRRRQLPDQRASNESV